MMILKVCEKITIIAKDEDIINGKKRFYILYQNRTYFNEHGSWKQVDDSSKTLYPQLKDEYRNNEDDATVEFERLHELYAPKPKEEEVPKKETFGDQLQNMMLQVLAQQSADKIIEMAVPMLDDHIRKTYGNLPQIHEVHTPTEVKKFEGVTHEKFDDILELVNLDIPVFLTGPAGAGKNVICKQIAKALDLEFYFTNAVTQEYKLTGFIDANGHYIETEFYKAFKNGGLFMLDELDASIPEVLIILNAAIANRYFDFPNGKIEAHPNFRVIAAGNTYGTGADSEYSGRFQLDAASLDRFAIVEIYYSEQIENAIAQNNSTVLDFCRGFREACEEVGIKHLCTYRTIERITKLSTSQRMFQPIDVLKMALYKELSKDDLNIIINHMTIKHSRFFENPFVQATKDYLK